MYSTEHSDHGLSRFLAPLWGERERQLVEDWLAGAVFEDAVPALEQTLSRDLGHGWTARPMNLGRSALQVVLEAVRLGPDDEVLLPSLICTGVAAAVIRAGARPVFVDVDEQFNVRLESVLEAYAPAVRAIVLPHMAGAWARDAEAIVEWARLRGVFVVEDCAQAQGLTAGGKVAGTLGDAAIFSSHGAKIVPGPGGGWVITKHLALARALEGRALPREPREAVLLRVEAFARSWEPTAPHPIRTHLSGAGSAQENGVGPMEMSDLEAGLLSLQLDHVPRVVKARNANADRWRSLLVPPQLPGLRLPPRANNVHCKMLLSFEGDGSADGSHALRRALWDAGVETEDWYSPLHLRPPFHRFRRTSMPVSDRIWRTAFSVPVRPNLSALDWQRIESSVRSFNPG